MFKKAVAILNLTESLCDVLPDDDHATVTKRLMQENAMIIPSKIKGVKAVDEIFCTVVESTVIIKVNIIELKAQLWVCNAFNEVEE